MRLVNRVAAALLLAASAISLPSPARAVVVEALYEGDVAGDLTEAGRVPAAADALRQVVVRVTGRRAAATDPALAAIYADAPRLAQTYRSRAAGQVTVQFDADAVDARLLQAGQRLWTRERPATLVVLVATGTGAVHGLTAPAMTGLRREAVATARLRGLPLAWPTGLTPAVEEALVQDALDGRLAPLGELAHLYGADGVLLGRVGAAAIAWSYAGPAGEVVVNGSAADALQELADRYGTRFAAAPTETGRLVAVVHGVRELSGYAAAIAALAALPGVRAATLEEATATTLRFGVSFDGDTQALRRAVRESGRLQIDEGAPSGGALQLVLRP